ncbi:MAG: hypothetical protein U1E05_03240, partial [Patescibacteria group bacterium]|nr:hypothetical protein [Patescibacteria group bacterium]
MTRRCFVPVATIITIMLASTPHGSLAETVDYDVHLETVLDPAEGGEWFQPRPAAIPGFGESGKPAVVMAVMQVLGSDYFTGLSSMRT